MSTKPISLTYVSLPFAVYIRQEKRRGGQGPVNTTRHERGQSGWKDPPQRMPLRIKKFIL